MDKDIKLLLKIIGICFIVEVILILLLLGFLFSFGVYRCYDTGGYWIFNKVSDETCMKLGVEGCKNNSNCVRSYSLNGGFDLDNAICKPRSGCDCPKEKSSWSFRGCENLG